MDQKGAVKLLFLCSIVYIVPLVLCNDGAFKILGGYIDVYNDQSSVFQKRAREWGKYVIDGFPERRAITLGMNYCWNSEARAYCHLNLVVSTSTDDAEEHYQLMGSKVVVYDVTSSYVVGNFGWGVQDTFDEIEDVEVNSGRMWSVDLDGWGFGYLHLFVRKEARPSLTDAFRLQYRKAGVEQFSLEPTFFGEHDTSSTKQLLSDFKTYTNTWGELSIQYLQVYTVPTVLVETTTLYDEKVSKPLDIPVLKSLTLENYGSGATSDTFALLGTSETFTLSTESTISTSFEFSIDVGSEVTLNTAGVGVSMSINLHSAYSSSSENKKTETDTKTQTIQWPSTCLAGMREKHIVTISMEEIELPILFTFERDDLRWTERKILKTTMSNLKQEKYDCCLWAHAHALCGTTGLPLCSQ